MENDGLGAMMTYGDGDNNVQTFYHEGSASNKKKQGKINPKSKGANMACKTKGKGKGKGNGKK